MAYCTKEQVRDATGMQNTTKIPDAFIDLKIAYADGLINSSVGKVYTLPLASTPRLIAFFSLEITVAALFIDQYGENSGDSDKEWQKRLDWILEQLELIRNGSLQLFDDATGAELAKNGVGSPSHYPTEASDDPAAVDSTQSKITMNQTW